MVDKEIEIYFLVHSEDISPESVTENIQKGTLEGG